MDQGELHSESISDCGCSLSSTCIRRDNNGVLVVGDVVLNPALKKGTSVKVIDRNIEESLVLRVMKVHSNNVVSTSASKELSNKSSSLSYPLFVTGVSAVRSPFVVEAQTATIGESVRGVVSGQGSAGDSRRL